MSALPLWTWEAPQSLLGLALYGWLRARDRVQGVQRRPDGRRLVQTERWAISLGAFVFWARVGIDGRPLDPTLIQAHELGHTFQSRRLGPLYLLTVGIASPARALYAMGYYRRTGRAWPHYFDAWPEDEADRLGGIVRDAAGRRVLAPSTKE